MAIQQAKQRYRVRVIRKSDGAVVADREDRSSYGAAWPGQLPIPKKIGVPDEYIVEVEYLGEYQFKQPYAKRLAAHQRQEEARKKREAELEEEALVLRRDRIMNQIELAFVKNGKDAVKFVTCAYCDRLAEVLGLTHENPGSAVINPDQITCALCKVHRGGRFFKTTAVIECALLEFFYDGIKQIYINRRQVAVAAK